MTPAAAIQAHLATTNRAASRLVGERHEGEWSRYVAGKASPSAKKIQSWLTSLAANGRPLALHWMAEGCSVVEATATSSGLFWSLE